MLMLEHRMTHTAEVPHGTTSRAGCHPFERFVLPDWEIVVRIRCPRPAARTVATKVLWHPVQECDVQNPHGGRFLLESVGVDVRRLHLTHRQLELFPSLLVVALVATKQPHVIVAVVIITGWRVTGWWPRREYRWSSRSAVSG